MEILLGIIVLAFALSFFVDKLTKFVKQLKISSTKKLLASGKEIHLDFTISSVDKKSGVHTTHSTNSKKDNLN